MRCVTDNMSGNHGQTHLLQNPTKDRLFSIFAELLCTQNIGINAEHVKGVNNELADEISRPSHFYLSHTERAEQIY
jgi:hypothetical protein